MTSFTTSLHERYQLAMNVFENLFQSQYPVWLFILFRVPLLQPSPSSSAEWLNAPRISPKPAIKYGLPMIYNEKEYDSTDIF